MDVKELKIENLNNKLGCDCFFEINFFPPAGTLKDRHFEQVYLIKNGGKNIYVNLIDVFKISFEKMTTGFTFPATALNVLHWKKKWLIENPKTAADTEMGIYVYYKIDDKIKIEE
jgi:hypothetical protein